MLPAAHRLRHEHDFRRLRESGRRWHHPLAILLVVRGSEPVSRFGFVASRRVGNSVVRNRTRRLLREVVRLHLDEIEPGWDVVFIARTWRGAVSFGDVEQALLSLLRRAGILKTGQTT